MIFKKITIQNFMSVRHSVIDLDGNGLVLVEGENVGSSAFRSNGAGKSTFPDAITYALYGVTARGLKNDEVINDKEGKNCAVIVEMEDEEDGATYEVGRYRKHRDHANNLVVLKDGNDISRSTIADNDRFVEELVGLSYTAFTNSVVFGQGVVKYFASFTDAEKKKVLEQLLEITAYEKALAKVKELKKEDEQLFKQAVLNIQNIDERLADNLEQLKEYENLQSQFEQDKQENLERIAERVESKELEIAEIAKDIKSKELKLRRLKRKMTRYDSSKLDEATKSLRAVNREVSSLEGTISSNTRAIRKIENEVVEIKEDLKGNCPTCLRKVTIKDVKAVTSEYEQQKLDRLKESEELSKQVAQLEAEAAQLEQLIEEEEAAYEDYVKSQERVKSAEREVTQLKRRKSSLEADLEELVKDFEDVEASEGYDKLMAKLQIKTKAEKKKKEQFTKQKADIEEQLNYYKFWEVGFGNKGIKSLLFESVVPFLNKTVGRYIDILSDNTIDIRFSSFKELKTKGKTKEEFDVVITNKNGSKNYKGNSGGERRRIDLAILLAFQKLVTSRSYKRMNFVIYDEVFENLDEIGTEKLVQLLKEIYDGDTSCYVITHNAKLKPYFSNTLKVRKENGISEYC